MSKVAQFLNKHPKVDGYTLICVLEEISRRVSKTAPTSVDTLLSVALVDQNAADYLVGVCNRLDNQEKNIDV
jgi:hypothetical protein